MENYAVLLKEVIDYKENGQSQAEIASILKDRGVSIITAIRVNREAFNESLADSKQYITHHSAWNAICKLHDGMHNELYETVIKNNEDN